MEKFKRFAEFTKSVDDKFDQYWGYDRKNNRLVRKKPSNPNEVLG